MTTAIVPGNVGYAVHMYMYRSEPIKTKKANVYYTFVKYYTFTASKIANIPCIYHLNDSFITTFM